MIPFVDLQAQFHHIGEELQQAAARTLADTQYVLGEPVTMFETAFANYLNVEHAVAVNSGTSALHLALTGLGIGPGDEVITVASTFVATAAAIVYTGATPIFADVDCYSLCMDPAHAAALITPRTSAIVPVHLHGHPAPMGALKQLADRHHLALVEDAAQAHGARCDGRAVGTIGDAGCFSFYPGKNLGACGEGGMTVTNDAALADTLRALRDWGQKRKHHHELRGFNYRMDTIQGALLAVKLKYLPQWTTARQHHAQHYTAALSTTGLTLPMEQPGTEHVYHVYAVRSTNRTRLQSHLLTRGIQTSIHYPIPVHLQPAYEAFGNGTSSLPITELAATELLSLPMYAELTATQIATVTAAINEIETDEITSTGLST